MLRSRPDFICLGMQRSGTKWLYDQLNSHSHFWMPPIKELHFFDDYRRYWASRTIRLNTELNKLANGDFVDPRDLEFLRTVATSQLSIRTLFGETNVQQLATQLSIDPFQRTVNLPKNAYLDSGELNLGNPALSTLAFKLYRRAFRAVELSKENSAELFTGDITPGYSTLQADQIKAIVHSLKYTKFILLLRNPISRMVSQLQLWHRRGMISQNDINSKAFIDLALTPGHPIYERSFPSKIVRKWHYQNAKRFKCFFFDDIVNDAEQLRWDIVAFITGKQCGSFSQKADHNAKAGDQKVELKPAIKDYIAQTFADEIASCKTLFGNKADNW